MKVVVRNEETREKICTVDIVCEECMCALEKSILYLLIDDALDRFIALRKETE